MSNLENLTQKILNDAKKSAEIILAEAEEKNKGIVSSRVMEAEERSEKILVKAIDESKAEKNRVISNAELQARDEKLKAKQAIMDKVSLMAKERLNNLSEKDYLSYLKVTLKNLDLNGKETLVVPEKFKQTIKNAGIINKVSDTSTVESGFLIEDGKTVINYTFDSLVDYLREELEVKIAQVIFKE